MKRKKGKFIADLSKPGDEILVARGGQGGVSYKSLVYFNKSFQCTKICSSLVYMSKVILTINLIHEKRNPSSSFALNLLIVLSRTNVFIPIFEFC